jgi:hypothetical protein
LYEAQIKLYQLSQNQLILQNIGKPMYDLEPFVARVS